MGHLKRLNKGERWRLIGESRDLGPGSKIEVKVGEFWIPTEIGWSRNTNDYICKTRGLYLFDGMPARLPR